MVPNGPAARAGLKSSDLIVAIDGQTVEMPSTTASSRARLAAPRRSTCSASLVEREAVTLPLDRKSLGIPAK
jgi:C-terminal processing protease CtpA/Prc